MKSNSRGLTLIELLMAAVLLSLVGLSFAALYGTAQRYLIKDTLAASVQGEAAYAMEHMRRHLMLADGVTNPAPPFPTAPPATTVTFTWTPALGVPQVTSTYQLNASDSHLLEYVESGRTETIARHVSLISFTRTEPSQMSITLTIQQTAGTATQQVQLDAAVTHRGIPPS